MSFRHEFEHRDALLDAAIRAFVTSGYDGASLSAILSRAKVSKGQFYYHFENKEELYLAVVEALIDQKRAWFTQHPVEPHADVFQGLAQLIHAGLSFARENPQLDAFARSFLRERGRPIFARALARFSVATAPGVEELIERGLRSGQLRKDLPPAFVGRAIGLVLQNAIDLLDASTPKDLENGLSQIVSFLKDGLGR